MDTRTTPLDHEPAKDTPFYQALLWRVHDPEEAVHIARTHRRHAAEARACIPDVIRNHQQQCVAAGVEQRARSHEEIAAVCERHAARLRLKAEARRRAAAAIISHGRSPASHPCPAADGGTGCNGTAGWCAPSQPNPRTGPDPAPHDPWATCRELRQGVRAGLLRRLADARRPAPSSRSAFPAGAGQPAKA